MADADPQLNVASEGHKEARFQAAKPARRWGRLALMLSLPVALIIGGAIY